MGGRKSRIATDGTGATATVAETVKPRIVVGYQYLITGIPLVGSTNRQILVEKPTVGQARKWMKENRPFLANLFRELAVYRGRPVSQEELDKERAPRKKPQPNGQS